MSLVGDTSVGESNGGLAIARYAGFVMWKNFSLQYTDFMPATIILLSL